MPDPIGDICVLREQGGCWSVSICRGGGQRERLAGFAARDQAAEFALAERDRRRRVEGRDVSIHFPDDCPCYNL